jgi:hypothetical protein
VNGIDTEGAASLAFILVVVVVVTVAVVVEKAKADAMDDPLCKQCIAKQRAAEERELNGRRRTED